VGEAPVAGPVMPLLSLTDIEEKLTVSDPKIAGGVKVPYSKLDCEYPTPGTKAVGHDCLTHAAAEADTVTEAVPTRLQPDRDPVSIAVAHWVAPAPLVGQNIRVKKSVTTAPEHDELDEEVVVELSWLPVGVCDGVFEGSGSSGSSGSGSLFLLPRSSESLCL
jgi:hypothetical protein